MSISDVATVVGGAIGFATGGIGGALVGGLIGSSKKPLKTAARVGATVVGGSLAGPVGAGIGRTAAGLATGEKFKRAVFSGLTAGVAHNYAPTVGQKLPGAFGSVAGSTGAAIAKTVFSQAAMPLIGAAASEGVINYVKRQQEKVAHQRAMMRQQAEAYHQQQMQTYNSQEEALKHSEALAKISANNIARTQKLISDYRNQRSDEIQGKKPKTNAIPVHSELGDFQPMPAISERKMNEIHKDNKVETWLEGTRYLSQRSNRFGDVSQAIYNYIRNRGRQTLRPELRGG